MPDALLLLILVIAAALVFDSVNAFHDTASADAQKSMGGITAALRCYGTIPSFVVPTRVKIAGALTGAYLICVVRSPFLGQ